MPVKKDKQNKKADEQLHEEEEASEVEDLEPIEINVVPSDQIKNLTEEQLKEEFTKALNANNPKSLQSLAQFNYQAGLFQTVPPSDQVAVHFYMHESIVQVESKERTSKHNDSESIESAAGKDDASIAKGINATEETKDTKRVDVAASEASPSPTTRAKMLKNQFNFSERASQTFNNPQRDRMVATEPPPTATFSGYCNRWVIFDTYLDALRAIKDSKSAFPPKTPGGKLSEQDAEGQGLIIAEKNSAEDRASRIMKSGDMHRALKLMERIVNLNSEEEIYNDFKYFIEEPDANREKGIGYFLPLWRFSYGKAKKKTVTAVSWNPRYSDMFAVSFGSYDFMKQQGGGLICLFSLKNTTHPEFCFTTSSGVMCIDFHPQHPALLAAGMYDGSVAVFDVRSSSNQPCYKTSDPKVKHTDPVWQIHWQEDDHAKNVNFYTISSDGRITNWIMSKNELINEEVMQLKLVPRGEEEIDEDAVLVGLAGGTCFDFNKSADHLFVVGTDEGAVHKCSKSYNAQYLETFKGHHMAIYAIKWNYFHSGVFMTCSADWTVKIWEENTINPLMSFDLGTAVSDIAWAPFTSTAFTAVTSDGKVYLFDLKANKHEAIGQQRVIKKGKLTHVAFNPVEPVILVGDDRGSVMSLKLSPNLHRLSAKKLEEIDRSQEIATLERVLLLPRQLKG